MRKIHLTIAFIIVIFLWLIMLIGLSQKSSAIIITVDDTGGADYTSIQAAIENSSAGDTVFVYSGTYNEEIVIYKEINLTGENKDTTIINGWGNRKIVNVNVSQVNISGFTIKNGIHGIYFDHSNRSNITNNILDNNYNMALLQKSNSNHIR